MRIIGTTLLLCFLPNCGNNLFFTSRGIKVPVVVSRLNEGVIVHNFDDGFLAARNKRVSTSLWWECWSSVARWCSKPGASLMYREIELYYRLYYIKIWFRIYRTWINSSINHSDRGIWLHIASLRHALQSSRFFGDVEFDRHDLNIIYYNNSSMNCRCL